MPEFEIKDVWPGWKTVRLIGRGSFGAVYEIERDNYGHKERAALKVISIPQSASDIDDLMSDGYDEESITSRFEGYMQDIVREYSLMADMKGCANIVYCDDWKSIQHDDGMGWDIFIKMELLTALPRALGKTVTDEQVIKIGTDICSALVFCEKRNLLHRDIKPQNIFIAPDGTYKLGDFGIAKTAERTTSGTKTGTYKYMAPEVYNNQPYGGKADIYSLGLVLYWLLNERRTPFLPLPPTTPTSSEEDKARARRFNGEPVPAPANGSKELQRIVLKACAYDSKDRYQSAQEMLTDLVKLGGERIEIPPVPMNLDAEKENEKTNSDCSGNNNITKESKRTVGPFEKVDWPEKDSDSTEDGKTVGVFTNPPQQTSEPGPKPKKWPAVLGSVATLVLIAAGLYFLPGWEPATCASPETHKLLKITRGEALEHVYGDWQVIKEATCTATGVEERVCANDPTHVEQREIPMADHTWLDATCDEPSICAVCGLESKGPIGHNWGEPIYIWANNNESVTANRVCQNDESHIETETARTTSEVTLAATCTSKGRTTYTANFTNSAFVQQKNTVENIPELGHSWKEATYTSPKTCERCGAQEGETLQVLPTDGESNTGTMLKNIEYDHQGRIFRLSELIEGTWIDWYYVYDSDGYYLYRYKNIGSVYSYLTSNVMPGTDITYNELSEAVDNCVGFTLNYEVTKVRSGDGLGDRYLYIYNGVSWDIGATFDYGSYGTKRIVITLGSPKRIMYFATPRIHPDTSSFMIVQSLEDVLVADYSYIAPTSMQFELKSSSSIATAEKTGPGIKDMAGCNSDVWIPRAECWLLDYETKYVRATKGRAAYLRYAPDLDYGYFDLVKEGTKVTILARQDGASLAKVADGVVGWIGSSQLGDS